MEVIAAWLFLFLQLTLLYLFWVASVQAPKPRFVFHLSDSVTDISITEDPDDKLDSGLDLTKEKQQQQQQQQADTIKEQDVGEVKAEKSELQLWGQNTIAKWGSEESMERKRTLIINELIQTEESYLSSLHQLEKIWIEPMTASAQNRSNGLTMKEIDMLSFKSLTIITNLHDALLPQLRSARDVGATFVKFGDFLKMYTVFVNSYDNILQVLGALRNSKKFQSFVQKVKAANPNVAALESFMIMPIQRVPRYLLLLRELRKNTPDFHHDYPALATATERIEKITSHINSAKANFENVTKIIQIQNRLVGYDDEASLIKPGRTLVHEGHLAVRKQLSGFSPIGRSTVDCVAYLFSDICLWTSTSHKFKGVMYLSETTLDTTADAFDMKLSTPNQDVTFVAENEQSRATWISRISPLLGKGQ